MEVSLPLTHSRSRSRLALLLAALAFALLALGVSAQRGFADDNANNYDCAGHLTAGEPQDNVDGTQIKYSFGCSGPILGFQIQPNIEISSFDTDVIVLDDAGAAVTTDSFSCNAFVPTWGINCIGKYTGGWNHIQGQFAIEGNLCDEPRIDPLLTVVYATATSAGVVTQYISGPFDLGRVHGCPYHKGYSNRIPDDGSKPTTGPPTKEKKKPAKAKAKKAKAKA
jgi:hypothetical protein